MDDLWIILLVGLLYVGPAILRKMLSRTETDLPEQEPLAEFEIVSERNNCEFDPHHIALPENVIASHVKESDPATVETTCRQVNFSANSLISGVIMAELLQSPRAYRPFRRNKK